MRAILRYVISLGAIVLVYAVINLILVGGQKLWHHGDQVKLDTLKAQLQEQLIDIKQREAELKVLNSSTDQSGANIANLKLRVQTIEGQYPSGIPQDIYYSYSQLVDQCNSSVASHNGTIARYNALYDDYSHRVERYNALIKESNGISNEIGGTWYVIPIPSPRVSHEPTTARPHE